jgi:hypothetical protein
VLTRTSRAGMSEEQQTRIDALIAPYKPLADDEAAKLRADKFFLLDTLYCEEPQIRQWALKELGAVMGSPVGFDVNASLPQRKAAISRLRESLLRDSATRPASAPAVTPVRFAPESPTTRTSQ